MMRLVDANLIKRKLSKMATRSAEEFDATKRSEKSNFLQGYIRALQDVQSVIDRISSADEYRQ